MPAARKPDYILPDEQQLRDYARKLRPQAVEEAVQDAQMIMYDAWDAGTKKRSLELSAKALATCPLCADAYLWIANEAIRSQSQRRMWYETALLAGELALGDQFEEMKGEFWGFLETRPLMRAKHFLALLLEQTGDLAGAAKQYSEMLELNPNDNQGVRELLASIWMRMHRFDELKALLKRYKRDDSPFLGYTRVLLSIAEGKPSAAALKRANSRNSHVLPMLVSGGLPKLPNTGYVTYGGADEAADFVGRERDAWLNVSGALDWLKAQQANLTGELNGKAAAQEIARRKG